MAGLRFQEHTLRILNNPEDARRDVEAMLGLHTGEAFVGVIPTVLPYILPQALRRCSEEYPEITIDVVEDVTHRLSKGLTDGDLDLALLSLPVEAPGLVAEPLLPEMASHRYRNHEDPSLLEFTPPQPSRTIGIVRAIGKYLTPPAEVFVEAHHRLALNPKRGRKNPASRKA